MAISSAQFLLALFFLILIFLHVAKKNLSMATMYGVQSGIVVIFLASFFVKTGDIRLLLIAVLMLIIKVILAPIFFIKLIKKHKVKFSASTYVNLPLTLIVVAALTALSYSSLFVSITAINPENQKLLSIVLSSMLISLFLMINRKGVLSQVVGVLSLENSIVIFGLLANLEQSPALQVGIIFDISVWIIIATIFASMIYQHFGSLDVTSMKHLKD